MIPSKSVRAFVLARPLVVVWLACVLFLGVLYYDGLRAWFFADDFAWLSLLRLSNSIPALLHSLFSPQAQGTMRFLSERAFFLVFESVFGLYNEPWRIAVFITAAADIGLIIWLCFQATQSRLAAGIAPFFWVSNATLATVMTWDSAYNEVLCSFFLMAALALFDKYLTTGRRCFWWWQMVVFTLGFGALEVNTVYPALAAVWLVTIRRDQKKLISLVPAALISLAYFLLHKAVAPFQHDGPYVFAIDWRMFRTFAAYWKWSFVTQYWEAFGHSRRLGAAIVLAATAVLLASLFRNLRLGRREGLFFAGWFLLTIGPMLPLPNHLTDYYLTIPAIGLAMLAGEAVADAVNSGTSATSVALLLTGVWLLVMIPITHRLVRERYEQSKTIEAVVLGVDAAERVHPGQAIVIDGVTDLVWDDAFADEAFSRIGLPQPVYLTPGTGPLLHPLVDGEGVALAELPAQVMQNALTHSQVAVYSIRGDHLRNITDNYRKSQSTRLSTDPPRRIEIGSPLFAYLLDSKWFPIEEGTRWMPGHASLKLAAPTADEELVLDGYHQLQHSDGVEHLSVAIDGIAVGSTAITGNDTDGRFHRQFRMPAELLDNLAGKSSVTVEFSVDPVLHDPDGTERGLVFGAVALK